MRKLCVLFGFVFLIIWLNGSPKTAVKATAIDTSANTPTGGEDWSTSWSMAGANPERTSWTAEEVRGNLDPLWYRPFEPYISQKVQIIAANNLLYISTAKGLYALDADTGAEVWVYPTELPLGHSPTIYDGVAYVGGFDHRLHAVNALTGQKLWTFEAGAGFHTNPLVVEGKVYAGNRDGTFYAIYTEGPDQGKLAWSYPTDGPILFSAAYKDGVVFFASNDSYAYALNAQTGSLVWKSAKLPGAGFHSWWPVVYGNRVIFAGSNNYRTSVNPGAGQQLTSIEKDDLYPNQTRGTLIGAPGNAPGNWAPGTPTINANNILNYFAAKPWRRTNFVLDRFSGVEQETAPVLWTGTHSGNRHPPVVGVDNVLYQQNNYMADPYIPGGHLTGWQPGNPHISRITGGWNAVDEPIGHAAGGNLIYWNRCCDRIAGAIDITIPDTAAGAAVEGGRAWSYFTYNLHTDVLPGYNGRYYMSDTNSYASFRGPDGNKNGIYGYHADTNAPIPYDGKVFMHRSNAVIAFADHAAPPIALPLATTRTAPVAHTNVTFDDLENQLETEVQKILNAGHLRPAYISHGIFDGLSQHRCGDEMVAYWHNSSETIYTLLLAMPHLSPSTQLGVQAYLLNELTNYPPYQYNHIGWSGAARETFILPNDVGMGGGPLAENYTFKNNGGWNYEGVWGRNPFAFYALWKYAEAFGGAQALFDASRTRLEPPPPNNVLLSMPFVHNAFLAGYLGYLELEALAGYPESTQVRTQLNNMLGLRSSQFTKNSAYADYGQGSPGLATYCRTLNVASNFMFMVPELATYLRDTSLSKVEEALAEYYQAAPYWFVTKSEEGFAENAINTLYDAHSLFMAKAWILEETGDELVKYLDVPAFAVGDLFYIQKLAAVLDAQIYGFKLDVASVASVGIGESYAFTINIEPTGGFTESVSITADTILPNLDVTIFPTVVDPTQAQPVTVEMTDLHLALPGGWWHVLPVTISGGGVSQTVMLRMLVNGEQIFLSVMKKG